MNRSIQPGRGEGISKAVTQLLLRAAIGEILLTALMVGVFALLGKYTEKVLWGALFGAAAAFISFLALSLSVNRAADRAESGDGAKAALAVQASSVVRLIATLVVYCVVLKADLVDPLASLIPLLLLRPGLTILEFLWKDNKKDGEAKP